MAPLPVAGIIRHHKSPPGKVFESGGIVPLGRVLLDPCRASFDRSLRELKEQLSVPSRSYIGRGNSAAIERETLPLSSSIRRTSLTGATFSKERIRAGTLKRNIRYHAVPMPSAAMQHPLGV
jgi:hypothetical protein